MDEKLTQHAGHIDDHCNDIDELKKKVSDVAVKLAVPLFLASIFGVVIGGVIVWAITHSIK